MTSLVNWKYGSLLEAKVDISGAKFVDCAGATVRREMATGLLGAAGLISPGGCAGCSTRGGADRIATAGTWIGAAGAVLLSGTTVSIVAIRFKLGVTRSSITSRVLDFSFSPRLRLW